MKFNIIYADPAWNFKVWNPTTGGARSAEKHYATMSIASMCHLPVGDLTAKDCALFMWATFPTIEQAFVLGKAWGFEYKSCAFVWEKRTKHNKEHVGMGYWTRANPEPCLLFTKGKPKRVSKSVRQLQRFPIGRHSAKPPEFHELITDLMGDLPRLELFARETYQGWVTLGNEIDGMDLRDSIQLYIDVP